MTLKTVEKQYPAVSTVPDAYISVWRRDYLWSDEGGEDTQTRVFWVQSGLLFADLRVPADRPDFAGVSSLAECSEAQLDWLAGQQGFAGWLDVDDSGEEALFHWHRVLDFQPDSSVEDIGRVSVQDGYVLEEGVDGSYREHWVRRAPESPEHRSYILEQVTGPGGSPCAWRGYLVCVGDYFMLAVDRRAALPQADTLLELYQGDREHLRLEGLDMEISFGLIQGAEAAYQIALSTHPFREGRSLFEGGMPAAEGANHLVQEDRGYRLLWKRFRLAGERS